MEPIFAAVLANDPSRITAAAAAQRMDEDLHATTGKAGSTPLHLAVAPSGASGTTGASDLQLEIVWLLLTAGATLADVDRNGITVADRIQSQALRDALSADHL
jgi:hypothetical protein